MNRKVVIQNGMARSGKDTLANHLQDILGEDNCQTIAFKDKLIEMTSAFLDITVEEFLDGYDERTKDYIPEQDAYVYGDFFELKVYEDIVWWKDFPLYSVHNMRMSKRQALIHVSETCIKPFCGDDFFGKATADSMEKPIVISKDGGFASEISAIVGSCRSPMDVLVVRIKSNRGEGINDSRKLLDSDDFEWHNEPQFITVENNKDTDLKEFLDSATIRIMDFLEE